MGMVVTTLMDDTAASRLQHLVDIAACGVTLTAVDMPINMSLAPGYLSYCACQKICCREAGTLQALAPSASARPQRQSCECQGWQSSGR